MRPVLLTILIVLAISCTDSGTEPQPMSHEFVWEIDTILPNAFQFLGITLWGSSSTNVYLGGHDGDGHQSLLRFSGSHWEVIDIWELGFNTITGIDGLDSSNLVVIGDGGIRGHIGVYANGKWDTLHTQVLRPSLHSVDMKSPSEIYIASVDGIFMWNGDNLEWFVDSTSSSLVPGYGYPFNPGSVRKGEDGIIYYSEYCALKSDPPILRMHMINSHGAVTTISEVHNPRRDNVSVGFWISNVGEMLLTGQYGIYRLYNGVATLEYPVSGIIYTGDDPRANLFSVDWKAIQHYNGITWEEITPESIKQSLSNHPIKDAFFIDNTLFVCVSHDGYHTLIYRGTHNSPKRSLK